MSQPKEFIFKSPYPELDIPNVSVPHFILEKIANHPDQSKAAFVDGSGDKRVITFAQYGGLVRKFAQGISAHGLKKGDVFALYLPNLPEYGVIFHGVLLAGGIATTINPLYTTEELENQIKSSKAQYIVTIGLFYSKSKEVFEKLGLSLDNIFALGESPEGGVPLTKLLMNDGSNVPQIEFDPKNDVAVIPYSSGTSGLPKGVVLTHRNILSNLLQTIAVVGDATPEDVLVGILPFFHIYGMTCIMQFGLLFGATVVCMSRFDLEKFLELVQEYKITYCHLVPPIILGLVKHPVVAKYDISSIRSVISGAAPLGNELQSALAQKFPWDVRQGYGMTELSPVTHVTESKSKLFGSIGKLAPNCEAKLIDVDTGESVGPNKDGELLIRGPNVMKEYLNNPEETARTIEPDGFLHTGDIARVDDDGNFWIVDRLKELIKYNGYQCPPAELENILLSHESIADACVVGSPDPEAFESNELPKAFVVVKPNASVTVEEIEKFVAERVAPYKKLRGGVEIVSEIPKSPSGKILRRVLKAREVERVKALLGK